MLEKKGDIQGTISTKNFQLTYAPIHRFALFANYKRNSNQLLPFDDDKSWNWASTSYAFEGGIGTFNKSDKHGVDFFTGYGQGYSSISYNEPKIERGGSSHFKKIFFQPDIYWGGSGLQANLGLRVSALNFYDFSDKSGETIKPRPVFFEPSLMLRMRFDYISVKGQLQYSIGGTGFTDTYNYSRYMPYKSILLGFMSIEIYFNEIFSRN